MQFLTCFQGLSPFFLLSSSLNALWWILVPQSPLNQVSKENIILSWSNYPRCLPDRDHAELISPFVEKMNAPETCVCQDVRKRTAGRGSVVKMANFAIDSLRIVS